MTNIDTKDLERIVSLYIDGELDDAERKKFESYLSAHPAAARDVAVLRSARESLGTKPRLNTDAWFWLKLSNRLEPRRQTVRRLRPAFAASLAVLFTVAVIGTVYYSEAPLFRRLFEEKKNRMESSLLTGAVMPFLAGLGTDDVLSFALSGSIALDSSGATALHVRNTADKGSQIEIVQASMRPAAPPVTVRGFCDDIGIVRHDQVRVVDSILGSYQRKLQGAILVGENDEIAIHEQLADLNRTMVYSLAATMEPPQRARFRRMLADREAPFDVMPVDAPALTPVAIRRAAPAPDHRSTYLVISRDTVGIAEVAMNVDSIHEQAMRRMEQERPLVNERMLTQLASLQRQFENNIVVTGSRERRVRVFSNDNAFRINFESPSAAAPVGMVEMVRPRTPRASLRERMPDVQVVGDSAFYVELPADNDAMRVFRRLPSGEFRFEMVDTARQSPRMKIMFRSTPGRQQFEAKMREMRQREQELIDLDSLLRESERTEPSAPRPGSFEL